MKVALQDAHNVKGWGTIIQFYEMELQKAIRFAVVNEI